MERRHNVVRSLRQISQQSTIHGLYNIGLSRIHSSERIFWIVTVISAVFGAIALSYSNWNKYSANPTIVSIQKDYRNWENPFPSVTGCFVNKMDQKKAEKYILDTWNINQSHTKFEYYLDFIQKVSNISFKNLQYFKKFGYDATLEDVNMLEIAAKVHPSLSGTLVTSDANRKTDWQLHLTEFGICFAVNSKFAHLLSYRVQGINTSSSSINNDILRCHYLNGLCYARYDSDPQLPVQYYIHSYLDVIHTSIEAPLLVKESEELEINYRMQETVSSPKLKSLSPSQRRCRFDDEPSSNNLAAFSSSLCYIECRYRLCMKLCGCKPFFYNFLEGRTCGIKGLICLSQHTAMLLKRPSELNCNCPQPCDLIIYFPQIPKFTKWEHGYFDQRITFRWGLLPPTTKFRRDVLFGFEDLVVSFGGTLALFLGISFISLTEILFLFCESLYTWYYRQN